jgi:probable phosphoglycerate mutase
MIYLIRHGQTEFNRAGRYQGHGDSPLTDLGRD